MDKQKTYEIKGYYFTDQQTSVEDTHFYHNGTDSLIDHQRMWFEEAIKLGYPQGGELDEVATIRANYNKELTEEQLITITNDSEYMDAPLNELFPHKLDAFLQQENQTN